MDTRKINFWVASAIFVAFFTWRLLGWMLLGTSPPNPVVLFLATALMLLPTLLTLLLAWMADREPTEKLLFVMLVGYPMWVVWKAITVSSDPQAPTGIMLAWLPIWWILLIGWAMALVIEMLPQKD